MEPGVAEIEITYSTISKLDLNPPEHFELVLLEV